MLRDRLVFGLVLAAALFAVVAADSWIETLSGRADGGRVLPPPGLLLLCVISVLIVLAARELCAMARHTGILVDAPLVSLSGVVICWTVFLIPPALDSEKAIAVVSTAMAVLAVGALLRVVSRGHCRGAMMTVSFSMFSLVYLGVLPSFLVSMRLHHSAWVVGGVLLVTKSSDIGAYSVGRAVGRHKVIPWLSPGKTWEGVLGGALCSALVAVAFAAICNRLQASGFHLAGRWEMGPAGRMFVCTPYPLVGAGLAGLLFGVVGQMGDLAVSLFKRDAQIKDASSAIPGFGGLLDVLDSPILVAPLAYWLLALASES